jgi:hypothetical protein
MPTVNIGIGTLPYLLFQFMPVILFGVFLLMSLLHQDIRAAIYSAGLLIAITVSVLIQKSLSPNVAPSANSSADAFMWTEGSPLSPGMSLNLVMYGFTFAYLLTAMIHYKAVAENGPTIAFFSILIAAELLWRLIVKDGSMGATFVYTLGALITGAVVGMIWAGLIMTSKNKRLFYLVGMNTRETCTASKKRFVCKRRT